VILFWAFIRSKITLFLDIPPENASWQGKLFETYGDEAKYVWEVAQKEPERVWTWIETDVGEAIVNGWHYVNRLGYFISKEPGRPDEEYNDVMDLVECNECGLTYDPELFTEHNGEMLCDDCMKEAD
jgi:hypothetical protein